MSRSLYREVEARPTERLDRRFHRPVGLVALKMRIKPKSRDVNRAEYRIASARERENCRGPCGAVTDI